LHATLTPRIGVLFTACNMAMRFQTWRAFHIVRHVNTPETRSERNELPVQAEISPKWRSLPYKSATLRDAHQDGVHRARCDLCQTAMTADGSTATRMGRQQTQRPEFVQIATILWFGAGRAAQPCPRRFGDLRPSRAGQILNRLERSHGRHPPGAARDPLAVDAEGRGDLAGSAPGGQGQDNGGSLDMAPERCVSGRVRTVWNGLLQSGRAPSWWLCAACGVVRNCNQPASGCRNTRGRVNRTGNTVRLRSDVALPQATRVQTCEPIRPCAGARTGQNSPG
jgi:hypothetical protein